MRDMLRKANPTKIITEVPQGKPALVEENLQEAMQSENTKPTKTDIENIVKQSMDEKKQDLQNKLDTQAEKV